MMKNNFLDTIETLIRNNGDNVLVGAIEIQKYVTSLVLDQRKDISSKRKEGYSVGWNASNDNLVKMINGRGESAKQRLIQSENEDASKNTRTTSEV